MRVRMMALCACTLLLPLPDGITDSPIGVRSAAGHGRQLAKGHCHAKKHCHGRKCRDKKEDPPPPPTVEKRMVDVFITGRGFGFTDGVDVPTSVFGDVYDMDGNLVGEYEEMWEPGFDADGNPVLNGVAMFTFNGADPTLSGTLTTANVTMFTEVPDEFGEPVLKTAGRITGAAGDLAGTTGDLAMTTITALPYGMFIYFESQATLTLQTQTGGTGDVDAGDDGGPDNRRRSHAHRHRHHHLHHHHRRR